MMRVAIVLGTRPEIIKLAPVIREVEGRKIEFFILHTGQHYSDNLNQVFFEQLALPSLKYNLEVGSGSHAEETGKMLVGIEKVLLDKKPDVVLSLGDTNSVLAGILAAVKLHIRAGHIEAGLRSYDRSMPEEINRTLADHAADYLFAPTGKAREILLGEGIPEERIFVTGNTIVDAVFQNLEIARKREDTLRDMKVNPGEYFLVTLHRQENVDDNTRIASILEGLDRVAEVYRQPVLYPVHPRARKMMETFGLNPRHLRLTEPIDFLSFLQLESRARMVLTDSGGVQEEACILKVPCATLRDNTERPETLEVGANMLVGTSPERIIEGVKEMLGRRTDWPNPFGDGTAGKRIINILEEKL